jgi:SAM-dependent methyltransferase
MQRSGQTDAERAHAAIATNPVWYHTLELAPGVLTPGWFDLRPIVDKLPWPDVRGKRCLDVGTYDGFLAFELEQRGAAEVVATDIPSHSDWDWPARLRGGAEERLGALAGQEKGLGFRLAKEALGSAVERAWVSVYDLDPGELGHFDVVVCGTLLLHLRDPIRALEAIRGVCAGQLLSAEEVDLGLTAMHPRRPVARFDGTSELLHWWVANRAGHRRMLEAAGFEVNGESRLYGNPFGPGHPSRSRSPRGLPVALLRGALTRSLGVPCSALLATPVPIGEDEAIDGQRR